MSCFSLTGVRIGARSARRTRHAILSCALAAQLAASAAHGYTELEFGVAPQQLSAPGVEADKARILRLGDGMLITAWQQAAGPADGAWTYEGTPFTPRDVFLRTSTDDGVSWSDAVNLSNTANQTDPAALYDRVGDGSGLAPYYGDSDKPNLFVVGSSIVVSWNDSYCGAGVHGPALYDSALGQIEVPFRCVYIARLRASAGTLAVVAVDRLTDAVRDANEEVVRGTAAGFAAIWQEDPLGLQPGEALGEGDGASGARVTEGTDIWWASLPMAAFGDAGAAWSSPIPISDNYDYVNGVATSGGSSRAQLGLVGNPAYAQVVYEERKNSGPADTGKYVIYHEFPFASPPTSEAGTIVSDPTENGRRARIVSQGTPGSSTGTRMVVMWRQGFGQHGAPSDFMMRLGRVPAGVSPGAVPDAGFRVSDIWPPVDPGDPAASDAPLNLSSAALDDATSALPDQDAKAHRAVLDGDFVFAGYTQVESVLDPAQTARFLVRRSFDGGAAWSAPDDVSSGVSAGADVIEPRLIRTPGTVSSGLPQDIGNPDVYLLAWGTSPGAAAPGDLYVTRTTDRGATYEPVQRLRTAADAVTFTDEAIQARPTPNGDNVYAVWIRRDADQAVALFSSAVAVDRAADLAVSGSVSAGSADLNASVTATFVLANGGPDTATGSTLTFAADPALTVAVVDVENGSCSGASPIVCAFDDLPSAASVTTTLTLRSAVAGAHSLVATAAALETEPDPGDNEASVTVDYVPKADVALTLSTSDDAPKQGKHFDLALELVNAGPQAASGLQARVALPGNLQARSAPGCGIRVDVVTCDVSGLAVGERWRTTIDVIAQSKGSAVVTATAFADEPDPDLADNDQSIDIKVRDSGGGGCSFNPGGRIDPTLPLLLVGSLAWLWRRRVGPTPPA